MSVRAWESVCVWLTESAGGRDWECERAGRRVGERGYTRESYHNLSAHIFLEKSRHMQVSQVTCILRHVTVTCILSLSSYPHFTLVLSVSSCPLWYLNKTSFTYVLSLFPRSVSFHTTSCRHVYRITTCIQHVDMHTSCWHIALGAYTLSWISMQAILTIRMSAKVTEWRKRPFFTSAFVGRRAPPKICVS